MKTAMRRYLRHAIAVFALFVLGLSVAAYIMAHQRVRWPWKKEMRITAEFENAQSITPGQGQTVNVAGVKVGEISKVSLDNGRAIVELSLQNEDLGPVYRNARMLLRPKTGLNDMSVQLDPGTPDRALPDGGRLGDGDRLPIEQTLPNIDLDEVLQSLDADTRNFLSIFVTAGGQGLDGRGVDLRRLLQAGQPTLESTRRVMRSLADRRAKVRRLVTNLRALSHAAAGKDDELIGLVDSMTAVVGTLADRERDLGLAVDRLPGTLAATRSALGNGRVLADDLGPAVRALRPTVRGLAPALVDVRPLLRDATPLLRDDLRPLVREATPLVRSLRPSLALVDRTAPDLITVAEVLNYVVNELAYNPPGSEEGFLFWASWFMHNANSVLSIEDAHGVAWRGLPMIGCSTFGQALAANPALLPLADPAVCPGQPRPVLGKDGERREPRAPRTGPPTSGERER